MVVYNAWEDLHWADPSTLELLQLYLDQIPTSRLLTVLTFRPDFTPINTKLGSKCQCGLKKIDLRPQAVAQVLGRGAALPDSFPY